jgi:hypothetical protein
MRTVGSLGSAFASARQVRLAVKPACAHTLSPRFPFALVGVLLVIFIVAAPDGIVGLVRKLLGKR